MTLQAFAEAGSYATHVVAAFSFPPHRAENFRYRAELGGGAMWDLGPYAVTPGRVIFGANATEILGRVLVTQGEVDTGFSVLAIYPGGRSVVGSFGFTTGYINHVEIMGPGMTVSMDRIFSPLPQSSTELTIRGASGVSKLVVAPADTFTLFFHDVFRAIALNDHCRFASTILEDARALERLRTLGKQ
jgi:predicted dehydrogenase